MESIFMKRTAALLLAAAMTVGAASCSKAGESGSSNVNLAGDGPNGDIAEENLPYGSTITRLMHDYDEDALITIEFDHRFFEEQDGKFPEIYKLTQYFEALNNGDGELMRQAFYPDYLDYSYRTAGFSNADEYIQSYHDSIAGYISAYALNTLQQENDGDFRIDCILVNDLVAYEENPSEFTNMDNSVNVVEEGLASKAEDKKKVYLECMYTLVDGGGSYELSTAVGSEITLYLYKIGGTWYVL